MSISLFSYGGYLQYAIHFLLNIATVVHVVNQWVWVCTHVQYSGSRDSSADSALRLRAPDCTPRSTCVWSLHVLAVLVQISSRCSGFFPQSWNMQLGELAFLSCPCSVTVCVIVCCAVFLSSSRASTGWWVPGVSRGCMDRKEMRGCVASKGPQAP